MQIRSPFWRAAAAFERGKRPARTTIVPDLNRPPATASSNEFVEFSRRFDRNWRWSAAGSRIAAAAVSHEVRNLCVAISLVFGQLKEKDLIASDGDFQGLASLVQSLQTVASRELHSKAQEALEEAPLRQVLDNLRIVSTGWWNGGFPPSRRR